MLPAVLRRSRPSASTPSISRTPRSPWSRRAVAYAGTLSATIALAGGNLKATAVDATLTAPVAGMNGPVKLAFTGDLEIMNGNMAATGINGTLIAPVAGMSGPVSLAFSARWR